MSEFRIESELPYSFWRTIIAWAFVGCCLLALLVFS